MMWTLKHFLFALLVATGCFVLIMTDDQDQKGFISLDCGLLPSNPGYIAEKTGLKYVSDAGFIDTGEIKSVAEKYASGYQRQMNSLRSFPEAEGTRNCYRINVTSGTRYLIQASFLYGNYDGKDTLPEFGVHIGANLWGIVRVTNASTEVWMDIIHVPPQNHIHVCLVKTGPSTPFISSLLFRPLNNETYKTQDQSLAGLALVARYDTGSTSGRGYRYPEDVYDRFWSPPYYINISDWTSLNTTLNIDSYNDPYEPPSIVMSTAAIPKSSLRSLDFDLLTDGDDTSEYYVYMHFAELEQLKSDQRRIFKISYNEVDINGGRPFTPSYLSATTFPTGGLVGGHRLSIYALHNSTHPPLLNAIEFYKAKPFLRSEANQKDIDAVAKLKSTYGIKRNWRQGDPCTREYLWEGLNCSYGGNYDAPRIILLDLSSSGLSGEIPPSISNLTMIQTLDLSNNNFIGPVPQFLSQLPNLKVLNLEKNNLKGSIPAALVEKLKQNMLSLSVCGNQDLIAPVSCESKRKRNNKLVIPVVVASVGMFLLLLTVTVIWWGYKGKRQHNTTSTSENGPLELVKRQFTYSEILEITNKFHKSLGKGGFGTVYHGKIGSTQVAVKMLSESSLQGYKEFLTEVQLLMRVHHRNLTSLVGYCNAKTNVGLIYEYMAKGNLQEALSGKSSEPLNWEDRLRITMDAAQGLEYLHYGCRPPIVHRDVKTTNILLNQYMQAKLSDFGLSKAFPSTDPGTDHITTRVAGTLGYLDPEYYRTYRLNEKSDVYSFGVVMLEIITGRPAVLHESQEKIHIGDWVSFMLEKGDMTSIVDPRLEGNFDTNCAWKAVEIAIKCISPRSIQRPTMNQVVVELKECLVTGKNSAHTYNPTNPTNEINPLYSITEMSAPSAR